MKLVKYTALVALLVPMLALAQQETLQVPFNHVEVKTGDILYARYNFDPSLQVIVCKSESSTQGIFMGWNYKNNQTTMMLAPYGSVTLKDNPTSVGYYVDPQGQLTFANKNIEPNQNPLVLSCNYQAL